MGYTPADGLICGHRGASLIGLNDLLQKKKKM